MLQLRGFRSFQHNFLKKIKRICTLVGQRVTQILSHDAELNAQLTQGVIVIKSIKASESKVE